MYPWIDPRIVQVWPEDVEAYLARLGWHLAGPGANPNLLLFDPPPDREDGPTFMIPVRVDQGWALQWMIDLVTELVLWQDRYAGDVLTDTLQHAGVAEPNGAVAGKPRDVEVTRK